MKCNVIHFISVLLLTFVYFTGAAAYEKTRIAIIEFQSGTIQQTGVLTDLLRDYARYNTQEYQIVIANNAIKAAISRYQFELKAGITHKPNEFNPEEISADFVFIPKADRFGNTYMLTATLLNLRNFQVKDIYCVKRKGILKYY